MDPADPLYVNAYALSYRLLGNQEAAQGVAIQVATEIGAAGGVAAPGWLAALASLTVQRCAESPLRPASDDQIPRSGLRSALLRRLERATAQERSAGTLVHLAGYPVDFVAETMGCDRAQATQWAAVIAPPPDVDYRELGDPALVGGSAPVTKARSGWRPHWSTLVVLAALIAFVVAASRCTGERPTFADPLPGRDPAVTVADPDTTPDSGS